MYLLHRFSPQVGGMWRTSSFARSFPAGFRISRLISSRFLSAPIHVWTSCNIMQVGRKEAGNLWIVHFPSSSLQSRSELHRGNMCPKYIHWYQVNPNTCSLLTTLFSPGRINSRPSSVIVRGWRREHHMMTPTTCGVGPSLSRTQTLIINQKSLVEVGGSNRQAIHRCEPQEHATNSTGRLGRSPRPAFPSGSSVGAVENSSLKIPTKTRNKKPILAPNFTEFRLLPKPANITASSSHRGHRGQRHHRRQSRTQPSKVWRRNRLWLIPKEVIRQVPSTFIRRLCKWEAGNSRKIQPPLPYKLPVCYVCMYVCHLCVVYMYVCNSLYL